MTEETAYEAGRRSGLKEGHNQPSAETIKMVGELKTELAENKQFMKDLKEKVCEGFQLNSEEHKEIMRMIKEELVKKADKWVEKLMIWLLSIIGVGIMGIVGTLIFQAMIHFNAK